MSNYSTLKHSPASQGKLDTDNTLLASLKEGISQPATIHTFIEEALAQHMVTLNGKLCELHTRKETILLALTTS